jgi:hypothetical protein
MSSSSKRVSDNPLGSSTATSKHDSKSVNEGDQRREDERRKRPGASAEEWLDCSAKADEKRDNSYKVEPRHEKESGMGVKTVNYAGNGAGLGFQDKLSVRCVRRWGTRWLRWGGFDSRWTQTGQA